MTVFGVILAILGAGSCIYGIVQNNSMDAQLSSIFSSGRANPGTIFILVGAVFSAIGIFLWIKGRSKNSKE